MALMSVKNLGFAFPGAQPLLSSIDFELQEGSFTVLLGANGSGKTTLLKQLHPILADTGTRTGSLLWRGAPLTAESEASEHIGFVMQRSESQIVTDKVWHELAFGLENLGMPQSEIQRRVAEISTFFGIQEWFDADVSELSGGQRQILNLASAMVLNPQLLILDEPTAQLDPISADSFIQMLHRLNYELGVTILAAEHELQKILPFATDLLFLAEGRLTLRGAPQAVIPQIMRRYPELSAAMPQSAQLFVESGGMKSVSRETGDDDGVEHGASDGDVSRETVRSGSPQSEQGKDVSRETSVGKSASGGVGESAHVSESDDLTSGSAVVSPRIPLTIGEGKQWLESLLGGAHTVQSAAARAAADHDTHASVASAAKREPAIEVRDLWFRYGVDGVGSAASGVGSAASSATSSVRGLTSAAGSDLIKGLDMTVYRGEVFALVGSNGSGKSTLISLLSGVLRPYKGSVKLEGKRLTSIAPETLFDHYLGVLPQDPQTMFVKPTVISDLATVFPAPRRWGKTVRSAEREERERAEITQGAEALGIAHLLERHPFDVSGGEQQLIALLKVLLLRPRILLLDEPTKGLDESAKKRLIELFAQLRKRGVTVLMVTHDIEFAARAADRAGLFFNGRVTSAEPVHRFFATNNFYTTSASRIARDWFPDAVTKDEVLACIR